MKHEDQRQRHRLLGRVMRDICDPSPEEPFPGALPAEIEELLWDYATGLLEPSEERRVIKLLARSEQAERVLLRIRGSMKEAGMPDPIQVPAAARVATILKLAQAEAKRTLAAVGLSLSSASVAGVIVKLRDGLVSPLEDWLGTRVRFAEAPVMAGKEQEVIAWPKIELRPSRKPNISVLHMPEGQVDIEVTAEPTAVGRVALVRLVPAEGGSRDEPIDRRSLKNGCVRFENCPEGILKIVLPDGREDVVCIQPPL